MNDHTHNPEASSTLPADTSGNTSVVTLDQPIARGDQRITHVTLRRPKAGELRGIDLAALLQQADYAALEILLPRISSPTLTRADVADLDPSDLVQFTTAVMIFFAPRAAVAELQRPA